MDRDALEAMLGEGLSLAAIGRRVGVHESTVAGWLAQSGLRPGGAERHAARGGIGREELEHLVASGLSIAEIAAGLGRSKATVRHWLGRHGLRTLGQLRCVENRASQSEKPAAGRQTLRVCETHGRTDFVLEGRGYYRCKRCRAQRVSERRRKIKETLVAEAGGECVLCGYSKCIAALQFHHTDPSAKRFHLSSQGVSRSIAKARGEAAKCVLLCANCHAEVEHGISAVLHA